jgi:all-trans-retinol 13,14-reductase
MYGIIKDCNNPLGTYLSPNTRIPNFLITGQNVGTHGLLGVAMTSLHTCASLININEVIAEIKKTEE